MSKTETIPRTYITGRTLRSVDEPFYEVPDNSPDPGFSLRSPRPQTPSQAVAKVNLRGSSFGEIVVNSDLYVNIDYRAATQYYHVTLRANQHERFEGVNYTISVTGRNPFEVLNLLWEKLLNDVQFYEDLPVKSLTDDGAGIKLFLDSHIGPIYGLNTGLNELMGQYMQDYAQQLKKEGSVPESLLVGTLTLQSVPDSQSLAETAKEEA